MIDRIHRVETRQDATLVLRNSREGGKALVIDSQYAYTTTLPIYSYEYYDN
jgi:hypothetical protein